jgi:hypothetical protein
MSKKKFNHEALNSIASELQVAKILASDYPSSAIIHLWRATCQMLLFIGIPNQYPHPESIGKMAFSLPEGHLLKSNFLALDWLSSVPTSLHHHQTMQISAKDVKKTLEDLLNLLIALDRMQ